MPSKIESTVDTISTSADVSADVAETAAPDPREDALVALVKTVAELASAITRLAVVANFRDEESQRATAEHIAAAEQLFTFAGSRLGLYRGES